MTETELSKVIETGTYDAVFRQLYGENFDREQQKKRYASLAARHGKLFGSASSEGFRIYSIPGRTELGGNHTDHNRGRVLAGAINLDTLAAAVPVDDMTVVIDSEGFDPVRVSLRDLECGPSTDAYGTTESLVRGIAAAFVEKGWKVGGFRANTTTAVRKGSGLSSSAAIEITIGSIFNDLYNDNRIDSVTLAKFGQYAENHWFGKPSGLMDQTACAYGGIIGIDFADPAAPLIEPASFSFQQHGFTLVVVDTGGNHADLTPAYAAIPEEMGKIAGFFGASHCRDITLSQLLNAVPELRARFGDRAVLRAYHFLTENNRVQQMIAALQGNSLDRYLFLVRDSGSSSFKYLQNLYPGWQPEEQGLSVGIALTEEFLAGEGACRVHGGGFAGMTRQPTGDLV